MAKQCNNDRKIHTKKSFFQGYNKPFTSENNIQSTFHYEITSLQLFPNQTTGTSTCVSLVLTSAKENPPPLHPPLFFLETNQSFGISCLHQQSFLNVGHFSYICCNCQSTGFYEKSIFFSFLLQSESDMLFPISKPANIGLNIGGFS